MASESKEVDLALSEDAGKEVLKETTGSANREEASDEDQPEEQPNGTDSAAATQAKKKKSKKAKIKSLLSGGGQEGESSKSGSSSNPASKLSPGMLEQLLEMNPSLRGEVAGMDKEKAADALKKLDVSSLLTGMSINGKNQKDMASYKFWQTQPVPRFDEPQNQEDGEIKRIDPSKVLEEPRALLEGFEWVTMDLENEEELTEVYELLYGHYVEDEGSQFRLEYSAPFFNWALKAPGWRKEWHVGVRATKSKKLLAFISAIPVQLKVRDKMLNASEVNFMCVHKKLRSKRLAPILIEEITRRCYLVGVFQAIYTGGAVLPKPLSSCRYFHRSIDWAKLHECEFAGLPAGTTKQRMITRNHLPSSTTLPGFRAMEQKDVPSVHNLLARYLKRFTLAPEFSEDEVSHWLVHDPNLAPEKQVVWGYVVEDPHSNKITDFMTFYRLDSSIIGAQKHKHIKAAYLFYYATEAAFKKDDKVLKERLNALTLDTLVVAKRVRR